MEKIESISRLEKLYASPKAIVLEKVSKRITPAYRDWIENSRFVILSTVSDEGTDISPRGDEKQAVRVADTGTLLLPDWPGNNRLDTLRNIIRDGRISLMFMVPGCHNIIRINGHAFLTAGEALARMFSDNGNKPKSIIVIKVEEIYFHCKKALALSRLWSGENESNFVLSECDFIREINAEELKETQFQQLPDKSDLAI